PLTKRTLESITNDVKITVYFEKDLDLYHLVWSMLKEYKFVNPHLVIEMVDYIRDPAMAQVVKAQYKLPEANDAQKNVIIFDGPGGPRSGYERELSELALKQL